MIDDGKVTGYDLAIAIPVWRRKKNIARVYESALAATPLAHIVFAVSEHDHDVRNALEAFALEHILVPGFGGERGDYARKINHVYRSTSEPFIFTGADDILFHDGWYAAARSLMSDYRESTQVLSGGATLTGPFQLMRPGAIGVVGTRDGGANGRTMDGSHSTHTLVARWYADMGCSVDQGHMIYDEGYEHEYCDDEMIQTAMARQAYAHSFGPIVEHVHMLLDASLDDDTYRHGRSRSRYSRHRFLRRQALWGGTMRSGRRAMR